MTRLYIATDGYDMCLWLGEADDPAPRCLLRECDVDPIVWDLIIGNLRVEIVRDGA